MPAHRGNAEQIKKFIIKPEYTNLDEIRDLGPDLAQIFYPDIMIINLDEIVQKLEIADVLIMIHI